ncbi:MULTISPECIES: hypothetical protein [unclassified Salipiger]|uniref:hypothetical protein n=1 Tax=unclassified Salipiger TaxID=2640570 RepID=UPI0013B81350|nr:MULTISPECIES: hypothetical protein [unclassified Salipiger]NDV50939.1 hypothetical protein [Salipiger sp. PrR003]NDW34005.1 hypothetical protein [Salipiger sp. PrR007]
MSRSLWYAPALALLALVALVAYRAGTQAAELTETEAIATAATLYAETGPGGAARSDCTGRPGEAPVWIVVTCAREDLAHVYEMDRLGRILHARVRRGPQT